MGPPVCRLESRRIEYSAACGRAWAATMRINTSTTDRRARSTQCVHHSYMHKIHARIGEYLKRKRNFLVFSVVGMGTSSAAILVWNFGRHVDIFFSVILVAIGLGAGLLWGLLMWEFFIRHILPPDK
jgi:hypothetical protein